MQQKYIYAYTRHIGHLLSRYIYFANPCWNKISMQSNKGTHTIYYKKKEYVVEDAEDMEIWDAKL